MPEGRSRADPNQELYQRIAAREGAALQELMERQEVQVVKVLLRVVGGYGTKEDVYELMDDVFLIVWNDIDKYDPERGTFGVWINQIAKFLALSFRRRRRGEAERKTLHTATVEPGTLSYHPEDTLLGSIHLERSLSWLHETLEQFPEDERNLLVWYYFEGASLKEIAERLGKTHGAIRTSISRLRRALREAATRDPGRVQHQLSTSL